jgi:putative ABC transport system permease protein
MPVFEDVRLALRLLRRTPVSNGVALLSIALSVGATGVVFTAVKSVLIEALPYAHPEELVQIRSDFANAEPSRSDWVVWKDAEEITRRTRTLASFGIYRNALFNLAGDASSPPEALYGLRVSASLFRTLGVAPMLGRMIRPEDDQPGREQVMVLSYGLWTRRFNRDPRVVGRRVQIDGHDVEIIGVMPANFGFPLRRAAVHTPSPYTEFWAPLGSGPGVRTGAMGIVARLNRGASLVEARQDIAAIGAALAHEFPATNRDHTLGAAFLRDRALGSAKAALWLLMAAAWLFLLIGCANVANLLLARGVARQHEISIRIAIGAGSGRIVGQLLTESCVLALIGGLGGYVLTVAAWKVLPALAPVSIPRLAAARADASVLGFTLLVAVLNGLLFGIVPALRAGWTRTAEGFSARGATPGRRDRMRGSLVVAEVAVTVTLVVIGGQFLGSFLALVRTDPGFDADRLLASVLIPAPERYRTPEQRGLFYRRVLDSVRALPGVQAAATVDALPFSGENRGGFLAAAAAEVMEPKRQSVAEVDVVSADYLQAIGVRLAAGRWFGEEDMRTSSDAAIVNDGLAKHLWPGADPLGRQICLYCTPENPRNWKRVIGVVSGVRHSALDEPRAPYDVYLAAAAFEKAQFLLVKTGRPAGDLEKAIRRAVAAIDPAQPLFLSVPMRTLIADSVADRRFVTALLSITGLLALMLAVGGVYGVVSYTTSRRTREIGVRMALGATPGSVHALVFRQGFMNVAMGLAIGLAASLALERYLRAGLAGMESANPGNIAIAMVLVSLAAGLACWLPARQATTIEPVSTLRQE